MSRNHKTYNIALFGELAENVFSGPVYISAGNISFKCYLCILPSEDQIEFLLNELCLNC